MAQSNSVFDVTVERFQDDVVRRSVEVPVLLDFWADWCGPCRTLTPVLEKLAREYGGAFLLGKVDTQSQPEIAQAFQVQSIPFVCLFAGGRPLDAFHGAVPERDVRAFLARAGIEPQRVEDEPAKEQDAAKAQLAAAKQATTRGDPSAARAALAAIADDHPLAPERDRLREGLVWLEAELDPALPAAKALLDARQALRSRRPEQAMEQILASVAHDRGFLDGLARKAMLLCFSLVGEEADIVGEYRRRLATLLY